MRYLVFFGGIVALAALAPAKRDEPPRLVCGYEQNEALARMDANALQLYRAMGGSTEQVWTCRIR